MYTLVWLICTLTLGDRARSSVRVVYTQEVGQGGSENVPCHCTHGLASFDAWFWLWSARFSIVCFSEQKGARLCFLKLYSVAIFCGILRAK